MDCCGKISKKIKKKINGVNACTVLYIHLCRFGALEKEHIF